MKSIRTVYQEILGELTRSPQDPALDEKQKGYDRDLTASIRLLESGFSLKEIIRALKELSPMLKPYQKDPRAQHVYLNHVLQNINTQWTEKAKSSFANAQNTYKKEMPTLANRFEKEKGATNAFGLAEDSELSLSLLLRDGHSPQTIADVVRLNSPAKSKDASYLATLQDGLAETQKRYEDIQRFSSSNLSNAADAYRYYAKDYLHETKTRRLTGKDDQQILQKMLDRLLSNNPEFVSHTDSLLPFLHKGILTASPVCSEPGRDSNTYAASVIETFQDSYTVHQRNSEKHYPQTKEAFLHTASEIQKDLAGREPNPTLLDALTARELLLEGEGRANLRKAILAVSPAAKEAHDPQDYVQSILDGAEKSLFAEREIEAMELHPVPSNTDFANLNLSVKELYQQVMRQRFKESPSFALEITEETADREAIERMLYRFPNLNHQELISAIQEASPRANLPGIPKEYAPSLIALAERRLKRVRERKNRQAKIEQKLNKLRGLSTEGVYSEENSPMSRLKDGRIATRLLRQGRSKEEVKQYLIAFAKASAVTAIAAGAFLYADQILEKAQLVLGREQAVQHFDAKQESKSCRDAYLASVQPQFQTKGFASPAMDIAAYRSLQEQGYSAHDIQNTILTASPVAAEPGRDEGYLAYIQTQAELDRQREEERKQHYVVTPRLGGGERGEERPSCEDELLYQREQMRRTFGPDDVPDDMDERIARALYESDYPKDDIIHALDAHPLSAEHDHTTDRTYDHSDSKTDSYGTQIFTNVLEAIQESTMMLGASLMHVLTRTVTTTTTVTGPDDKDS